MLDLSVYFCFCFLLDPIVLLMGDAQYLHNFSLCETNYMRNSHMHKGKKSPKLTMTNMSTKDTKCGMLSKDLVRD